YKYYQQKNERIQQCFITPGNKLSVYEGVIDNGIIKIEEGLHYNLEIRIKDFHENETIIKIPVEGKTQEVLTKKEVLVTNDYLIAEKDNAYKVGKASVFFPANTFYDNFYIDLNDAGESVIIHTDEMPVHKNYTLTFDVSNYSPEEKKQLFIANVSDRGRLSYESTVKRGNTFSTRTKSLGKFTIAKDSLPPSIKPLNFYDGQWISNYRYLKVKVDDDLTGLDEYRATINGKWILMEYEYKDKSLTFDFNDVEFEGTKHDLEVIVTDKVGNSIKLLATIYRKILNN